MANHIETWQRLRKSMTPPAPVDAAALAKSWKRIAARHKPAEIDVAVLAKSWRGIFKEWDKTKHPRAPAGSTDHHGGTFVESGGGGGGAAYGADPSARPHVFATVPHGSYQATKITELQTRVRELDKEHDDMTAADGERLPANHPDVLSNRSDRQKAMTELKSRWDDRVGYLERQARSQQESREAAASQANADKPKLTLAEQATQFLASRGVSATGQPLTEAQRLAQATGRAQEASRLQQPGGVQAERERVFGPPANAAEEAYIREQRTAFRERQAQRDFQEDLKDNTAITGRGEERGVLSSVANVASRIARSAYGAYNLVQSFAGGVEAASKTDFVALGQHLSDMRDHLQFFRSEIRQAPREAKIAAAVLLPKVQNTIEAAKSFYEENAPEAMRARRARGAAYRRLRERHERGQRYRHSRRYSESAADEVVGGG